MNRRGFLGLFAGAVAGATLDPERALWIPGAKTISIPKPQQLRMVSRYMLDGEVMEAIQSVFPICGMMAFSELIGKLADATDFDISFTPNKDMIFTGKTAPIWK